MELIINGFLNKMPKIKRDLFDQLKAHLGAREISLIVGPRQAGKTTIMTELRDYLDQKGRPKSFPQALYGPEVTSCLLSASTSSPSETTSKTKNIGSTDRKPQIVLAGGEPAR